MKVSEFTEIGEVDGKVLRVDKIDVDEVIRKVGTSDSQKVYNFLNHHSTGHQYRWAIGGDVYSPKDHQRREEHPNRFSPGWDW
jgi:hypothetical protein